MGSAGSGDFSVDINYAAGILMRFVWGKFEAEKWLVQNV